MASPGKAVILLSILLVVLHSSDARKVKFDSRAGSVGDAVCDWPNGQQYWPHPTDCHMFIQCTPYGPQEMSCAPGTAWTQALTTCDFVANTDCGQEPPAPTTAAPTEPPAPVCSAPFKLRGDECFYVSEDSGDRVNWDDARQRCIDMGSDLAEPKDMVDFVEYIKESYNNSRNTIWLGATDKAAEGEWFWLSGEPVPPAMWKGWPGKQPSGDGNCMEIHWRQKDGFYMNDWYCRNKGYYACEIDMKLPAAK